MYIDNLHTSAMVFQMKLCNCQWDISLSLYVYIYTYIYIYIYRMGYFMGYIGNSSQVGHNFLVNLGQKFYEYGDGSFMTF